MSEQSRSAADRVIDVVLRHRRRVADVEGCRDHPCERCRDTHRAVVAAAAAAARPVRFVLPAFPAKSPNRAKVLGRLPDMAERVSLRFLHSLTERVRHVHEPGAEIVICSDGRAFGDVIGVSDRDITTYRDRLREMIAELPTDRVRLVGLEDFPEAAGLDHVGMRELLITGYAEPLEVVRERVRSGVDLALYRGLTRFLVEDADPDRHPGSRSALQRGCRARAYQLIQRSRAWGAMVERNYPDSIRLSIHPQPCGAEKIGINLTDNSDDWLTPWHGVAVRTEKGFVLMKRADAERMAADLVTVGGRPSHYATPNRPEGD